MASGWLRIMHEPLFEKHRMNQIKGDCNNMALYNFIRPSLYIENLFLPPRSNRKYGFLEIYMRIRDCCGVNYIFIRLSTSQVKGHLPFHFSQLSPSRLLYNTPQITPHTIAFISASAPFFVWISLTHSYKSLAIRLRITTVDHRKAHFTLHSPSHLH